MLINILKSKPIKIIISVIALMVWQNVWGKDMDVLQGNIRFKLEIEGHGLRYYVSVNDIMVFKQLDQETQNKFELPLNHLMHPEQSKFRIVAGSSKIGPMPSGGEVNLTLLIQDRDSDASYRLPILSLNSDNVYDTKKPASALELEYGRYHLAKNNKVEAGKGNVELSEVSRMPFARVTDWFDYSRLVTVPNNLPLWAFFNMDDLPNYDAVSDEKLDFYRKDLFDQYKKIQDALLTDNIDSIMPMFKLRNDELDIAFDFKPGTMEIKLRAFMQDLIDDPKAHLQIRTWDGSTIYREENKKLVSLFRAKFTNFLGYQNENGIYSSLAIMFGKKDGKWIIAR